MPNKDVECIEMLNDVLFNYYPYASIKKYMKIYPFLKCQQISPKHV